MAIFHDTARLHRLFHGQGGDDIYWRDSMNRTVLHYVARWFPELDIYVYEARLKKLIDLGADINARDLERKMPLHCVLIEQVCDSLGDITAAVDVLVKLGANINAQCDHRVTSLHRAIQQKNLRVIETLARLGVDVNGQKHINCTAVHVVTELQDTTLLKRLVKLGADINVSASALTPLLEAVELGRIDIIEMLVQNGAHINVRRLDHPPIILSVLQRRPEVVKSLVQLGAEVNAKLIASYVVNEAVKLGRVDIVEYLVRHGAEILTGGAHVHTALGLAVKNDFHEMVDCLLKTGVDVNIRYDLSISPLVIAMRQGDTEMVKTIAKLEPMVIKVRNIYKNITVLFNALHVGTEIMKLLLKYGGDVNLRYDHQVYPVHDAVAQGNGHMLRVLAELGANLNVGKKEGISLIHCVMELSDSDLQQRMDVIKLLVEAGLDLNQCYTSRVTPLHDAVRTGKSDMVKILGELQADMNITKIENKTPFITAIEEGTDTSTNKFKLDVARYIAENGFNVNGRNITYVTPVHDAVSRGDVDMVRVLINAGADPNCKKHILSALHYAVSIGNEEGVKCLLEFGADVNAKGRFNINPLHDAVENADQAMIRTLLDCISAEDASIRQIVQGDKVTPLGLSVQFDQSDITEILLIYGADMNCLQYIRISPLDLARDERNTKLAVFLMSKNVKGYRDNIGSSPLHTACEFGHIDLARLLIIEGSDVAKHEYFGRKPLEMLPLADTADYHVLRETTTTQNITEQVMSSFVSTSGCQDMGTSLHTPGIGDVRCISSPSAAEILQGVNQLIASATQCQYLEPIGSSAEGTRNGLPNEMDFLFGVHLAKKKENKTIDLRNGYVKYDYRMTSMKRHLPRELIRKRTESLIQLMFARLHKINSGSAGFHKAFIIEVMNHLKKTNTVCDKVHVSVSPYASWSTGIRYNNRKACSLLPLMWNDGNSIFQIPVDIVPGLHIDNWPEGATTKTWLMNEQELRSRGYVLVPKPPHVASDLAKECTEEELRTLWKISFPHLETEHMQRLEQRVKDVYITAKCLRNPDVCRIMITDNGSLPRNVSKYLTSYLLKMCFFQNVDYFRQHVELCLEEMVCKVFDDLVLGLSKNFIPLFFLPKVSALSGIKLDVSKCVKVAKVMARFVRALYLRDCLGMIGDGFDDQVVTCYQRIPSSVYRIYDISTDENDT